MYTEKMLAKLCGLHLSEGYEIEKYSDSNRLYKRIEEGELADIYILDVLMPLKNGIDIGNQIRSKDGQTPIIYTTSSQEFALDAYGVRAARYLTKPLEEEKLNEAVQFAVSCMGVREEPVYLMKTQEGMIALPYSKILYIEYKARILYAHLTDGRVIHSLFIRASFDEEIRTLLESQEFLQIHKSFVVNLRYAEQLSKDSMVLENGRSIPVSKNKYAEVKREYLLFMVNRYR